MGTVLKWVTCCGVLTMILMCVAVLIAFPRPETALPTMLRMGGRARRCLGMEHQDDAVLCMVDLLTPPYDVRGWDAPKKPRASPEAKSTPRPAEEKKKEKTVEAWEKSISLRWQAPFYSGGGYCSEAISYVEELSKHLPVSIAQHGDSFNPNFARGLPEGLSGLLNSAMRKKPPINVPLVEVCHSEPGAWSLPTPRYHTSACPSSEAAFTIGRTMFETDRLPEGWVDRLNKMDLIWVPTSFARAVFEGGGVDAKRLRVVPEAVDTALFDPTKHAALDVMAADSRYKFLSVFKWEERKGWDILLRAFLAEFPSPDSGAALYIRTTAYHSDSEFEERVATFARETLKMAPDAPLSHIIILKDELPLQDLPRLYAGADCFVLASRGEGWGRPHIEAMAMGVPTMATNWSGNTEFMKEHNSFLIPIDGLVPVREGAFKGHLWADPSVDGLRRLLRSVFSDPASAREVGKRGGAWVRERYNPQRVGALVLAELRTIAATLIARQKGAEL